jgi:cellulose synthase/poly-beta-1,6-N-acetylglucosamine synthase-like glycosyltransferase
VIPLLDRIVAEPVVLLTLLTTAYAYSLALYGRRAARAAVDEVGTRPDRQLFYVLVLPCLNERSVIARTIEGLLKADGRFVVLLVDDASDDGSVEATGRFIGDPRLIVVPRRLPDARVGKAAVLNTAVREIVEMGLTEQHRPDDIVVVVFDADGRIEPDFLSRVEPYFSDPRVAGVQAAVRMTNRASGLLASWQHLEFVVWGEIFSRAKDRLGTATLGGNGQCVRLSALLDLGPEPWRASLTEDLDLSLRLIIRGWRIRFCPETAVWQQAVPQLGRLIRQRARWAQGHFGSWRYVPALARSRRSLRARIDLLTFLLLPALFVPIGIGTVDAALGMLDRIGRWAAEDLVAWYVLGFAALPLIVDTLRRAGERSGLRAVVRAHLFVLYSFVWVGASGIAAWHVIRGHRSWAKTARTADPVGRPAAADV